MRLWLGLLFFVASWALVSAAGRAADEHNYDRTEDVIYGRKHGMALTLDVFKPREKANGAGVADAFPPLAKSDYLNADKVRAVKTVTGGLEGKVTVNGNVFNGVMPQWDLPDEDIANVMTYIYSKWDNSGIEVRPAEVQANRVKNK